MNIVHVFDIDTTIANNTHRAVLLQKTCVICLSPKTSGLCDPCPCCKMETISKVEQSAWDLFFDPALVMQDTCVEKALIYADKLRARNSDIHYLTGRSERHRTVTDLWLRKNFNKQANETLIMRPLAEDPLLASQFKERALRRFIVEKGYSPDTLFFFYEDDPHVLSMYGRHGIVIKCPEAWEFLIPDAPQELEKPFDRL